MTYQLADLVKRCAKLDRVIQSHILVFTNSHAAGVARILEKSRNECSPGYTNMAQKHSTLNGSNFHQFSFQTLVGLFMWKNETVEGGIHLQ